MRTSRKIRRLLTLAAGAIAAALAGCGGGAPTAPPRRVVDLGQGWSLAAPAEPAGWTRADAERLHGLSHGTRILPTGWLR